MGAEHSAVLPLDAILPRTERAGVAVSGDIPAMVGGWAAER